MLAQLLVDGLSWWAQQLRGIHMSDVPGAGANVHKGVCSAAMPYPATPQLVCGPSLSLMSAVQERSAAVVAPV